MSKNTEILLEILTDQNDKLEKLVSMQNQSILRYEEVLKTASNAEISTKRLEEVIDFWNKLFDKQKAQIKTLQNEQIKDNKIHRIVTYVLLAIIALTLIFNTF